jgi:hypothetical protein
MNAFDAYVSNRSTTGGAQFLEISLTSLRGLTSGSFNVGVVSDKRVAGGRYVHIVAD